MLARAVRQRHRPGSSWRRQAVLARTNAQLEPLRRALVRQNIPVTAAAEASLIRRPEITAVLGAWNPGASLVACVADTRQWLRDPVDTSADPGRMVALDTLEARANVEAFLEFAEDHLSLDPDSTVNSFTTALRADNRLTASWDGVDLMTFHAAKGLEWPIVHLVGLEDGLVPIAHARTAAARAEERRLLHVAVTRAEQELHVLWCDRRDLGGQTVDREPSPWLKSIAEASDPGSGAVDHREAIARARQQLRSSRDR